MQMQLMTKRKKESIKSGFPAQPGVMKFVNVHCNS